MRNSPISVTSEPPVRSLSYLESLKVKQDLAGARILPTRVRAASKREDLKDFPRSGSDWGRKDALAQIGVFPLVFVSDNKTGKFDQAIQLVLLRRGGIKRAGLSFAEAAQRFSKDLNGVVSGVTTRAGLPTSALKRMGVYRFNDVYIIQRLSVPSRLGVSSAKLKLLRSIVGAMGDLDRSLFVIQCDDTMPQGEYSFFEKLGFARVPSASLMIYLKPFVN